MSDVDMRCETCGRMFRAEHSAAEQLACIAALAAEVVALCDEALEDGGPISDQETQ